MVDTTKVMTMIMAGGKGQRLEPLTREVPKPAVPFGGIYKIIDFTLSNCLNSNLRKLYVLVQYRSAELLRHIRDGWQIYFSTAFGEFIEAIPPQYSVADQWYTGTADSIYQNLWLIEREQARVVLILAGDHIYKMDYRHMLEQFQNMDADVVVGAVEVPLEQGNQFGIVEVDEKSRVIGFQEKPERPKSLPANPNACLGSMGIYAFRPSVLFEALNEDAQDRKSSRDFGKDILPKLYPRRRVFAFPFVDKNHKQAKYWRDVGTLDAYYRANMDLVSVNPDLNLYDSDWPIRAAPVPAPPPKFVFAQEEPGGRLGVAMDSLVSPGGIVSGGRVQTSVLSPFTRVNSWSRVDGSILFERVSIGRHAKVQKAIIAQDVQVPEGETIGYNAEEDRRRFLVTEGGIVVVPQWARF